VNGRMNSTEDETGKGHFKLRHSYQGAKLWFKYKCLGDDGINVALKVT
jgi:hypothetical protein